MIAMNKETNWQFGRCPVCDAITSLDPENNQLCDRCYSGRSSCKNLLPMSEDNITVSMYEKRQEDNL
jgi:hypothetical protein